MNKKIIRSALALLFVSLIIAAPRAQQPATANKQSPENRVALYQALLDLMNPWTVMCIAAHPDDEDGTSLIVMRRKFGAHTVSLFSTFGEGGQNAIGPELYEELGAIRARETMAAAEIQGSEPHFLGLKDFGFSKSADEAFRVWGHDEALRRMVLQIRKLRPDVIITNHSATNNDHGHHQATARLELEAFDAAADPTRFPEQLKDGVTVWQVQRLFVRVGRSNQAQADNAGVVSIDPNERDPIRGVVYAEEALRALQKHATQGPWPKTFAEMLRFRNSQDGKLPLTRYVLVREAKSAEALPKDSHNFVDGLRLPDGIAKQLEPPTIDGHPLAGSLDNRSLVLEQLKVYRQGHRTIPLERSDDAHRFMVMTQVMTQKVERALALAAGVTFKVEPSKVVTPNSTIDLPLKISNSGTQAVAVLGCSSCPANSACLDADPELVRPDNLMPGSSLSRSNKLQIPDKMPINTPLSRHLYEPNALGLQVNTSCSIHLANVRVQVIQATRVDVGPPIEIADVSPSPIIKTPAAIKRTLTGAADCVYRDFDYNLQVTNNQDSPFTGEVVTSPGFGRKALSRSITVAAHDKADITLNAPGCPQSSDPKKADQQKPEPVTFTVMAKGMAKPLARLDVPVVWADARVAPNLRVGYVRGFDYSLPNALAALGVESKELTVDEVKTADLQKYSTIIVDNRVYESQPELIAANQKLLDYAKDGGTLVVFYHKSNEWNPDERRKRPQLAPYKLILGDERITDETAPITFIEPEHTLLNFPNKMGQEDFAGWIQERGLYYPKDWDANYHALLQSNDPGEAPLKGGLLVADYGRGHYIYTSMVWYRELRGGVPGAYRMLANMISYGHSK